MVVMTRPSRHYFPPFLSRPNIVSPKNAKDSSKKEHVTPQKDGKVGEPTSIRCCEWAMCGRENIVEHHRSTYPSNNLDDPTQHGSGEDLSTKGMPLMAS